MFIEKSIKKKAALWGIMLVCIVVFCGCAFLKGSMAKSKYIRNQTETFVYNKPLNQVWGQARQMLFEKGYEVKDSGPQDAETEWKESGDERSRYLLSAIMVSDQSCKVQFMKATQSKDAKSKKFSSATDTERDLDLEYKLIKKVAPTEHARIEKEAQAKADEASK